jgi:hypothetical protein
MTSTSNNGTRRKASMVKRVRASSVARSAESHRLSEVSKIPGAASREAAVRELIERTR